MSRTRGLAVLGASGGCGTTTVAIGSALAVQRAGGDSVLVELDLARGDLSGNFGVPRERSIADLEGVADELTEAHVAAAAFPHRSGMRVLFAPTPPARATWGRSAVALLLSASAAAGHVVVDLSGGLTDAALGAIDQGAAPVIIASATRAGARRAAAFVEALPVGCESAFVLSHAGGVKELSTRAAERMVGLSVVAELPDSKGEADALAAGRWPTKRKARLAQAIEGIASQVLP
jgi:pilus assembly protein CpaE